MDTTLLAISAAPARCIRCAQHLPPLALPAPQASPDAAGEDLKPWERAARTAHHLAHERHNGTGATLPQCRRLCQILLSTTLSERERERLITALRTGCTKLQASRALDYLAPRIESRRRQRQHECLLPLLTC
jgi:hypothetical protein